MHLGEGGEGSSLPYISIAFYMQKGGEGVQIACKIAYVLNGRPLNNFKNKSLNLLLVNRPGQTMG